MKTNKVYLLLLALMAVLSGCSEEGLPGAGSNDGSNGNGSSNSGQTFSISVSDGGYAPAEGNPQDPNAPSTRATEDGYLTKFAAGDRIGVFAVKNNAIVTNGSNVCLTAVANGSGIKWNIPDGAQLPPDATYYAYYPYRSSLTGALVPSLTPSGTPATDAAAFFANVISNWAPATDQSTQAKYTAQDLMIAKGTVSGTSLSLSMTHQMALAVIDLPKSYKYTLTTDVGYTWTAPVTSDKGCLMADGTYHYLMKPRTATLSGTCLSGHDEAWSAAADIPAGRYKIFTINGGSSATTPPERLYTLRAGDFYMKDGSGNAWLKNKDATMAETEAASCLGIVYWVGDIAGDNYGLLKDGSGNAINSTHGLVVALWNAKEPDTSSETMTWTYGATEGIIYQLPEAWPEKPADYNHQSADKMQGYVNMVALEKYNKHLGAGSNYAVKPIDALADFRTAYPAPKSCSGWYWPSVCELKYVCWGQEAAAYGTDGKTMLNKQIGKVSGGTAFGDDQYWSSTEYQYNNSEARYVAFSIGIPNDNAKTTNSYRVRPILAF